jgi:hypothetical protein
MVAFTQYVGRFSRYSTSVQNHFLIVHIAVGVTVFKKFINSNYIGCMGHTSCLNLIFYIFPAITLHTHVYSQLMVQLVFNAPTSWQFAAETCSSIKTQLCS